MDEKDYERIEKAMEGYYPRFSEQEYQNRYKRIRNEMNKHGLDCLLIYGNGGVSQTNEANVVYVSNHGDWQQSYVIFPLREMPTLLNTFYCHLPCAKAMSPLDDVRWGGFSIEKSVVSRIKELKLETARFGIVGIDSIRWPTIPHHHFVELKKSFPQAHFGFFTEIFERIRDIKSDAEIEFIKKGAEFTDIATDACIESTKPGVKEYEIFAETQYAHLRRGGRYFFQILGSTPMLNPSMPYPWPFPSERTVKEGDIVTTEIGASYHYMYAGCCIRTIAIGEPPREYRDLADIALEVYERILRSMRPGNTNKDLLKAAEPICEAGYTIQAPVIHSYHPFRYYSGISGMSEWNYQGTFTLEKNMTFHVEPNPCTPDLRKGVFMGNLCRVTEQGGQSFQEYPPDLVIK
jgi:Xaa-Pro aminopeptidase